MSGSAKQIPHTTVESTIFHKSNLLTTFHIVTSCRGPVITNRFPSLPLHVLRGSFISMSCQSRDRVPLIMGFSSIRVWVNQPCHQSRRLGNKRFYGASREVHSFYRLYKGTRIPLFHPCLLLPLPIHSRAREFQRPSSHFLRKAIPNMSGAGGRRMVSSITDADITKLQEARYLAANIAHRLPDAGKIVPTPEPHERVVLLAHFVR